MMYTLLKFIKVKTVYCFATVSVIFVIFYLNNTSYIKKTNVEISTVTPQPFAETTVNVVKNMKPRKKTKYILLWTNPNSYPFVYFGEGNSVFINRKCEYVNCYITSYRQLLRTITEYDIVAFNGPQLLDVVVNDDMPLVRTFRQKYVYANIEAAINYPMCQDTWNNFFNWTWTYRLDSDAMWGYIVIRNSSNHIIGPSIVMDWMNEDDMDPIDQDLKLKLSSKNRAAAWFVSNCNTLSKREDFVNELQTYINDYNLKIDIYGSCGTFQCPQTIMNKCLDELERNYYFYFAFENAVSEDYVTEKVLYALNHNTVPVVYGGADYSRFLPPGSYLNAYKLGAQNLAKEMFAIIENRELYYRYFRWKKYYSFHPRHESPDSDDYCKFCAMANDDALMAETKIYDNISAWWTPVNVCSKNN